VDKGLFKPLSVNAQSTNTGRSVRHPGPVPGMRAGVRDPWHGPWLPERHC